MDFEKETKKQRKGGNAHIIIEGNKMFNNCDFARCHPEYLSVFYIMCTFIRISITGKLQQLQYYIYIYI